MHRAVSVWPRPGAEPRAVRTLHEDLASGRWAERKREFGTLDAAELGLRLLIARTAVRENADKELTRRDQ